MLHSGSSKRGDPATQSPGKRKATTDAEEEQQRIKKQKPSKLQEAKDDRAPPPIRTLQVRCNAFANFLLVDSHNKKCAVNDDKQ